MDGDAGNVASIASSVLNISHAGNCSANQPICPADVAEATGLFPTHVKDGASTEPPRAEF